MHPLSASALLLLGVALAPSTEAQGCSARTLARHLEAGPPGPRLRTPSGPPIVGRAFSLQVSGGPAGAPGFLLFGLGTAPFTWSPFGAVLHAAPLVRSEGYSLDTAGRSSLLSSIPALDPALCGRTAVAQATVLDPSAQGGVAFTNGIHLAIGLVDGLPYPGRTSRLGATVRRLSRGDLNLDGIEDLVASVQSLSPGRILLGNGDGTFRQVQQLTPRDLDSTLIADLDGDGLPDLAGVLADDDDELRIWLGNGDGTVREPAIVVPGGEDSRGLAAGDLNADTHLDIVVANRESQDVSVFLGLGDGNFAAPVFYPSGFWPSDVAIADFDEDGALDVLAADSNTSPFGGRTLYLYPGRGDGTLDSPHRMPLQDGVSDLSVADLNRDGHQDVALAFVGSAFFYARLEILLGRGDGTFEPAHALTAVGQGSFGETHLADLDGDGVLDALLGSPYGFCFAIGDGTGSFTPVQRVTTGGAFGTKSLADFDGDGRLDVVMPAHLGLATYLGIERSLFPRFSALEIQNQARRFGAGDLNRDGVPDLVVAGNTEGIEVLLGDGEGGFSIAGSLGAGLACQSVLVDDVTGDGRLDTTLTYSNQLQVFAGDGTGGLSFLAEYSVASTASGAVAGDLDEDGLVDLAVATSTGDIAVLFGLPAGGFGDTTAIPMTSSPLALALADADADGHLDLLVANGRLPGGLGIRLGVGDGTFGPLATFRSGNRMEAIAVGYLDGDPHLDVFGGSRGMGVSVLLGNGDGTFQDFQAFNTLGYPRSLHPGDFDLDGKLDILALTRDNSDGLVELLLGDGQGGLGVASSYAVDTDTNWLSVRDFDLDGVLDLAGLQYDPGWVRVYHGLIGE